MSWINACSRPSKNFKFPPPLYLYTPDNCLPPYCHTCGRINSSASRCSRSSSTFMGSATLVKYCSERCRRSKPGPVDHKIEDAFVALLEGDVASYLKRHCHGNGSNDNSLEKEKETQTEKWELRNVQLKTRTSGKGDPRRIVWCSDVEMLVFGPRSDLIRTAKQKKNRTPCRVPDVDQWKEWPKLSASKEVHETVLGENEGLGRVRETQEMIVKRKEGQRRADEREMVRKVARRGVVFGYFVERTRKGAVSKEGKNWTVGLQVEKESVVSDTRRKCEAVMTKAAILVDPSFAKGDWGIRWRQES